LPAIAGLLVVFVLVQNCAVAERVLKYMKFLR